MSNDKTPIQTMECPTYSRFMKVIQEAVEANSATYVKIQWHVEQEKPKNTEKDEGERWLHPFCYKFLNILPLFCNTTTHNMQKIYKYPLEVKDVIILHAPKGAKILSAALHNNEICIWALVNPDEIEQEQVTIEVYGTGNIIETNMLERRFLGTVVAGRFVWHIFEKLRERWRGAMIILQRGAKSQGETRFFAAGGVEIAPFWLNMRTNTHLCTYIRETRKHAQSWS